MTPFPHPSVAGRWPAYVLLGAGGAGAIVMLFHPAGHGADDGARLHALAALSTLAMHVHLAMIVVVIALRLALAYLARAWPGSGWVWIGARLYSLGAGAMLGAALISGFLVSGYLDRMAPFAGHANETFPPLALAFAANQVLAGFGTVLMSLAIIAWSMAMVRQRQRLSWACGVYGIGIGVICVAAYAGRWLSLDVAGMTTVVVAHGVWYGLFGLGWLRGTWVRPETD